MSKKVPLIVILGSTGTGKSKLSIEIARRFKGEIISADSMQVYKGLDIITNKVTQAEREMAPHHLLDFLNPLDKYKVVDFRDKALPIIDRLMKEGKIPIVVGGTHYYIESLVWKVLVENLAPNSDKVTLEACVQDIQDWSEYCDFLIEKCSGSEIIFPKIELTKYESALKKLFQNDPKNDKKVEFEKLKNYLNNINDNDIKKFEESYHLCLCQIRSVVTSILFDFGPKLGLHPEKEISKLTETGSAKLHEKLSILDPDMAKSLHPNNKRKILRSLQVLAQGRKHSEILKEQQDSGGSYLGGPLRFKDAVMLWIQCQEEVLEKRLDDRVDDMVSKGLIQELINFHESYNKTRIENMDTTSAYTQGIFQSIGFKEFHDYLLLSEQEKNTNHGQKLLNEGIASLKNVTKRYARKQQKWITNRFLKSTGREVPPVYALDATDLTKWDENVFKPAESILMNIIDPDCNIDVPQPMDKIDDEIILNNDVLKGDHFCDICQRVFIGNLQWEAHISSKKHQRTVKKRQRETPEEKNKRIKE